MKTRNLTGRVFSLAVLSGVATASHGAGFQLLEQSASGLGNAYAGSAAIAENASTIYFNPAGMTYLPGVNVSGGATAIRPSFKFRDNGLSRGPLALGGAPSTSNGGDAGSWGVVPNAYMSWQINDRWFAGVGLGAPFGLKTEYEDDWAGALPFA
jgi:long-chain fatty acid transport protein